MNNIFNEDIDTFETRRQKLIRKLMIEKSFIDLKLIMKEMEYSSKKNLLNDIESISKSLKNKGLSLIIEPPSCLACNFKFKLKNHMIKIPSKCPNCRQERIDWPSIMLKTIKTK